MMLVALDVVDNQNNDSVETRQTTSSHLTDTGHRQGQVTHRVQWRLWSQYSLYVVGQKCRRHMLIRTSDERLCVICTEQLMTYFHRCRQHNGHGWWEILVSSFCGFGQQHCWCQTAWSCDEYSWPQSFTLHVLERLSLIDARGRPDCVTCTLSATPTQVWVPLTAVLQSLDLTVD